MAKKDRFRFDRTGVLGLVDYDAFGCKVFKEDPPTPDRLRPDVVIEREFDEDDLTAPDGRKIRVWGFVDPRAKSKTVYPSSLIRVRQGQIVHTHLKAKKGPHTIHHHGINPTTMNDGVGHVSMEVGDYTYQWQAAKSGTNFYHCHRNTVLHFEMGMLGLLIIDPPEGPGHLFTGGPAYDVEKFWIVDDMDPRFHEEIRNRGHEAGLCGEDVGLNRFEPKYFLVSGAFSNNTLTDRRAVISARVGDSILIRLLNASYSIIRTTLGIDATVYGVDGHFIGSEPWEHPFVIPANQPFELTSAQRYGLIIRATERGAFPARIEFLNWVNRRVQDNGRGVIDTKIVVS